MATSDRTFTVFGAGLAGSLMAIYLARAGHRVHLYERRPDPRTASAERGRSINLALSTRGIDALERIGLAEEVLASAIPMPGRMIHSPSGELTFQQYARDGKQAINSVSRAGLNEILISAADREENVEIHFDARCTGVDFDSGEASVLDGASGQTRSVPTNHIIGADGAFSGVRSSMQRRDRFSYSQDYLTHGYKELTIPAGEGGSFAIEKQALHIWPRGTYMMIALPNADGSFTCTLFWPFEGPNSFAELRTEADILSFFKAHFADAVPLIPNLVDDFQNNPTSSLATVRCAPWNVGDRAVLIGDAAHAIVPFYGQGMNASFEDVVWLDRALREHPDDIALAFDSYASARKPHADAIADLALRNFIEMRDLAGRRSFRTWKKIDQAAGRFFPESYIPLYDMVSFSTIPYADAVEREKRQIAFLKRLGIGIVVAIVLVIVASVFFWAFNR